MALENIKFFHFLWMQYIKSCTNITTTTNFYVFDDFLVIVKTHKILVQSTIDLMCHSCGTYHPNEEPLVLGDSKKRFNIDIINYNEL